MERVQNYGQYSLFCPNESSGLADYWGEEFEKLYTKYEREDVPIESHPSKLVGSIGSKNIYFDFDKLAEVTTIVTENLNKIIDVNYYPVETARRSNMRHRLIGIGVQGLADTFILLGMPFDSQENQKLNKDIFETIYYHALKASSEIAAKEGTYETYQGSPAWHDMDGGCKVIDGQWEISLVRCSGKKNPET
ncbi:uncharacterized protein A4U43_C08F23890 [Asparagus officinalis]|nr:uncharacterized protein A4U43_C08F23890 [Asparagus officinalis]